MNTDSCYHLNFAFLCFLFLGHQFLQYVLEFRWPFIDNYLDPFCAGGLSLFALAFERHTFFGERQLNVWDISITTIFIILISELGFPYWSEKFTADIWDAFAITTGAVWFVLTSPSKVNFSFFTTV